MQNCILSKLCTQFEWESRACKYLPLRFVTFECFKNEIKLMWILTRLRYVNNLIFSFIYPYGCYGSVWGYLYQCDISAVRPSIRTAFLYAADEPVWHLHAWNLPKQEDDFWLHSINWKQTNLDGLLSWCCMFEEMFLDYTQYDIIGRQNKDAFFSSHAFDHSCCIQM